MKKQWLIGIALVAAATSCKEDATQAEAERVDDAPAPVTAESTLALVEAEYGIANAFDAASMAALRQVEVDGRKRVSNPPADVDRDDATRFTIFFAGNNQGERQDCGCRRNPLGGLARRHTMLDALSSDAAADVWGDLGPARGPVFHVDSGESLFKSSTISRGSESAIDVAKHDASTVVAALSTFPPDAMLAGEVEFAFGLEDLKKVTASAKFPLISANVQRDGELVFPASVVVERDGVKLGIVGVTKKETRWSTFWDERKLTVEDPLAATQRAVDALPDDVTAIVLLSNLGLGDTRNLIDSLESAGKPVHFSVVSNTNRLTAEPEFVAGVPYMEPLSRGKYVGRADFIVNGDEIGFRNAGQATPSRLRDHRRAVRSYWSTRKQILRKRKTIAELRVSAQKAEASTAEAAGTTGESGAVVQGQRSDAAVAETKRLETLQERLKTVSEALLDRVASFSAPGVDGAGDDWVVGSAVPVKIEIDEEPSTKRVVDRREKRRPEEKTPPGRFAPPAE